jgi:hypothetical protein
MERDWAEAIVTHDAASISRIVAEDWSETSWDGTSFGKAQALADLPLGTTESITRSGGVVVQEETLPAAGGTLLRELVLALAAAAPSIARGRAVPGTFTLDSL